MAESEAAMGEHAPPIRLPAAWTLAGLGGGLALGWALSGTSAAEPLVAVAQPVGTLWLRALQMTIIPLIAALLVGGVVRTAAMARAGIMARRTLGTFYAILGAGTLFSAFMVPALLDWFPIPGSARNALAADAGSAQAVPGIGAFFESLVAPNVIAAAAETAMLPLIVFFALFAVALTRISEARRKLMLTLFGALGDVMLVMIGWILWLAPAGVFALALGVGVSSGAGAFAALAHYIVVVSGMGLAVLVAAYFVGPVLGGTGLGRFIRAVFPAQAVAISTQSSLASLPAMLAGCRQLGLRETSADFVLPLAVAIFRATSPAMNLAVAIYVAKLTGVPLTPGVIAAGAAVALLTTAGSVSLPGTISFISSVGPIALAMGVPLEPLVLLVAVEMLPDIMRTLGNVTMDVAVTSVIDRRAEDG